MCNLYFARATRSDVGNLPTMPGIFPDYAAPIVRDGPEGRELVMARWGMPSPVFALKGRNSDPGVTNIRNVASPHWASLARRREPVRRTVLVVLGERGHASRVAAAGVVRVRREPSPLAFFAGLWTRWTSVRKVKEGETTSDLFGFLTTEPNVEVKAIHPKAMPVILRTQGEVETWLTAPTKDAVALQRPLPDGVLRIVARGLKTDAAPEADLAGAPLPAF